MDREAYEMFYWGAKASGQQHGNIGLPVVSVGGYSIGVVT